MLNLNSTIDMDFKTFLRWWRRELSFLVPEKIKRLINDKQGFIIVRAKSNNKLELSYYLNQHTELLATLERNAAGIAQYKTLQENDERLEKATVILRLTGKEAVQKELVLPTAAKENLDQVVSYELDRYTPFKAEQVYFCVQPLTGSNEPGQIRVLLIVTPKEFLDGLYEDIKALGLSPLLADYEGAANDLDKRYDAYNLLPEKFRQKTAKMPRLIYTALIASAAVLLVAVLAMPVWFEYQTVEALQEKTQSIEKEAKKIKAVQLEIDAVIDETRKLIDEKNAAPTVLAMLNELSRLIKDDTWLAYLQYSDGHLQLQGESPTASTLISVLEASELFANTRFVSPVTQDITSKLERFQITVDVTKAGGKHENDAGK
jgi:general secretion pathway protein L